MSTLGYEIAVEPDELRLLQEEWGTLPLLRQQLVVDDPFLTGEHQLLVSDHRRAEICYVLYRGNLADGVLLHIKRFYPTGAFRLPTGGIHQGEQVMATLAREITEETGLAVGTGTDQVRIERCLGLIAYQMDHRSVGRCFPFATYHFLVQMPLNGVLAPQDETEEIAAWQWCKPVELYSVAETLEQVGQRVPAWGDWGRYRALSHRFVADALAAESSAWQ